MRVFLPRFGVLAMLLGAAAAVAQQRDSTLRVEAESVVRLTFAEATLGALEFPVQVVGIFGGVSQNTNCHEIEILWAAPVAPPEGFGFVMHKLTETVAKLEVSRDGSGTDDSWVLLPTPPSWEEAEVECLDGRFVEPVVEPGAVDATGGDST